MPQLSKLLVIDDDHDICTLLSAFLTKNSFQVNTAYTGRSALSMLQNYKPDLILCDFRLDDITGAEVLESSKQLYPELPVVIMTGYSDVRTAVQMMKSGASDYVTKPLLPEEILNTITKCLHLSKESIRAQASNAEKPKEHNTRYFFGRSASFNEVLEQIALVAPTNFSVIIYGESGSGKESIAREIHARSKRNESPFIAIDCGSISKELAGSELFGHEKGAFTSAISQKIGSLELANGGTVFLDEIGNLSYDVQVTLLRVVQERKMRRVGGNRDIDLDVRILVASNERLTDLIKKGRFREDLYHRFNEFSIEVPALRHRKEDILLFANHFLTETNKELHKEVAGFDQQVLEVFHNYPWPGNLRELNNVIKRCTLLSKGTTIHVSSLPYEIIHFDKLLSKSLEEVKSAEEHRVSSTGNSKGSKSHLAGDDFKLVSIEAEMEMIIKALKSCKYNKSKAAQLLQIDRKTLYNKMKQFDLLQEKKD